MTRGSHRRKVKAEPRKSWNHIKVVHTCAAVCARERRRGSARTDERYTAESGLSIRRASSTPSEAQTGPVSSTASPSGRASSTMALMTVGSLVSSRAPQSGTATAAAAAAHATPRERRSRRSASLSSARRQDAVSAPSGGPMYCGRKLCAVCEITSRFGLRSAKQ
eukprot:1318112-Pleurochrysis_carterae.AAC.3